MDLQLEKRSIRVGNFQFAFRTGQNLEPAGEDST
jgi:hypothetical protein